MRGEHARRRRVDHRLRRLQVGDRQAIVERRLHLGRRGIRVEAVALEEVLEEGAQHRVEHRLAALLGERTARTHHALQAGGEIRRAVVLQRVADLVGGGRLVEAARGELAPRRQERRVGGHDIARRHQAVVARVLAALGEQLVGDLQIGRRRGQSVRRERRLGRDDVALREELVEAAQAERAAARRRRVERHAARRRDRRRVARHPCRHGERRAVEAADHQLDACPLLHRDRHVAGRGIAVDCLGEALRDLEQGRRRARAADDVLVRRIVGVERDLPDVALHRRAGEHERAARRLHRVHGEAAGAGDHVRRRREGAAVEAADEEAQAVAARHRGVARRARRSGDLRGEAGGDVGERAGRQSRADRVRERGAAERDLPGVVRARRGVAGERDGEVVVCRVDAELRIDRGERGESLAHLRLGEAAEIVQAEHVFQLEVERALELLDVVQRALQRVDAGLQALDEIGAALAEQLGGALADERQLLARRAVLEQAAEQAAHAVEHDVEADLVEVEQRAEPVGVQLVRQVVEQAVDRRVVGHVAAEAAVHLQAGVAQVLQESAGQERQLDAVLAAVVDAACSRRWPCR